MLHRSVARFLRATGFTPAVFSAAPSAFKDRRRKAGGSLGTCCRLIAAIAVLFAVASAGLGDETDVAIQKLRPKLPGKLKLKLNPSLGAIRSDAPFAIDLDLESTFSDVLDGELELSFIDDGALCVRLHTGPIAVPTGPKSFHLFLPSMSARQERANFVVQAVFHGPRGPLDLGTHDLVVPLKGQRQLLIGTAGLSDATVSQFARQLSLDAFRPPEAVRSVLLTLPVELDLRSLPSTPLGLYPFDVLVFVGEHFSRLMPRQLDTIAEWVEMGGGIVVVPTGVLTPAHVQFLERLANRDANGPRFILDQLGRLKESKTGAQDWITTGRYGYGRALILRSLPGQNIEGGTKDDDAANWTRAVGFLWNVRPRQIVEIFRTGHWTSSSSESPDLQEIKLSPLGIGRKPMSVYRPRYSTYDETVPLHSEKFAQADALRALLFPEDVQVVPFKVVAILLTLFLLAIAPADYFLLGLLRRRKYTWILFPTSCIVFTVVTVRVAQHYTGTIDHRGALIVVDIGEQGKPLRTTRIEHIITAGTRAVSTEIKDGLFSITNVQPAKTADRATAASAATPSLSAIDTPQVMNPVEYAGTFPGSFTASRLSRQWTPSMDRVTTLGAQTALPSLPWSAIEKLDASSESGRHAIAALVEKAVPGGDLLFMTPSEKQSVPSKKGPSTPSGRFGQWRDILAALAHRAAGRLFSIVSRISPNAAGDLEDLSVLDEAQPEACLMHVALQRGEDLVVLRRLLSAKGQPTRP